MHYGVLVQFAPIFPVSGRHETGQLICRQSTVDRGEGVQ